MIRCLLIVLMIGPAVCQAEQFWVSYDAACGQFPEQCGWTRTTHGGGAARSLADGILTLDSTASSMICDYYRIDRPITPGPGETFVAEWRMRVALQSGCWESLMCAEADDGGDIVLEYGMDGMGSLWEGWSVPIVPGAFHAYRLESASMYDYSLWIDGVHVRDGVFDRPGPPIPFVVFGDGSYGTAPSVSLTEW
jgi:hypothetical protein